MLTTVVPSLKLFAIVTREPTLTGCSRIVPVTVAKTRVLFRLEVEAEEPVRVRSSCSTAESYSILARR